MDLYALGDYLPPAVVADARWIAGTFGYTPSGMGNMLMASAIAALWVTVALNVGWEILSGRILSEGGSDR